MLRHLFRDLLHPPRIVIIRLLQVIQPGFEVAKSHVDADILLTPLPDFMFFEHFAVTKTMTDWVGTEVGITGPDRFASA